MNHPALPRQVAPPQLPVPTPERIGQGTAVEMSRAVAEVHAAMYGAQQFPRNEAAAIRAMENSCRQTYVAEKAFYRLPRGKETVTGPTVHLARELARCWGHIQYGIVEMRRDDEHGQSEMQAFAWDVQTGTRLAHTFIQPHKRDKRDFKTKVTTAEPLTTLQEIYEVNANNGARRLRECIFGVLPQWFTERAKQLASETLDAGDGTPLADRIEAAVAGFKGMGVGQKELESKLELPRIRWTGHELGQLGVIFRALKNNETTREQEFPQQRVTTTTVAEQATGTKQAAELERAARDLGLDGAAERDITATLLGRPVQLDELTGADADAVLSVLRAALADPDDPGKALDGLLVAARENAAEGGDGS